MNKYIKPLVYTLFLIISAFLLSGCTPSQEKVDQYNSLVSEAETFTQAHEYSSALEKYNEASSIIPSDVKAYKGIIDIFVSKNRLDDAKKVIDESASKLSANDRASLYVLVADAYYNQHNYDSALNTYKLAEGITESGDYAALGLGKVYLQKGDIEKAKGYLNRNLDENLKEESKLIYSYVLSLEDKDKALSEISDIQPSDEWKDAYSQWKSVMDSLDDDTLFNSAKLAREYVNNGYPYLAISILDPIKEDIAQYQDAMYLLGKAYYDYGNYQESIDTLSNINAIGDTAQYVYWTQARAYYKLNNINESFGYYDSSISFAGESAQEKLYQEYIELLLENNQTTKAESVLLQASKLFTSEWVNISYIRLSYLNDQAEKIAYYVSKVNYDSLEGNYKKEYLYWKSKYAIENSQFDEAKRSLDLYWDLDKFDSRYNYLMGMLNFQEGNLDESRTYLKKSIEYDMDRSVTDDAQNLLARID